MDSAHLKAIPLNKQSLGNHAKRKIVVRFTRQSVNSQFMLWFETLKLSCSEGLSGTSSNLVIRDRADAFMVTKLHSKLQTTSNLKVNMITTSSRGGVLT